ncbi:MAG: hypothetical protein JXA97_03340 [Anaerolineales bacterium]|nr:hypothetical protein [Anaerolineales bacterium]
MQYFQKSSWPRYAPLLLLILLDAWLLYSFSIVQEYPVRSAGFSLWIPLAAALLTGSFFFSASPGIFFNRKPEEKTIDNNREAEPIQDLHVLLKVLAGLTFLTAGFIWMLLLYRLDGFYITPDSYSYARVSENSFFNAAFWSGERPFTLPLLFKLFHIDTATLDDPAFIVSVRAKQFTQFQAVLSLTSFTLLGMCATTFMRRQSLKALILTLSVAFAMTIDVAQWNRMLLSESASLSLSALMLSAWLLSFHALQNWKTRKPSIRRIVPAAIISTTVLFSFTRDVNAYFVGLSAAIVLLSLLIPAVRKHPAAKILFIIGLTAAITAGAQIYSMDRNERWLNPLSNVISKRILTSESARDFFIAHGAPFDEIPAELLPADCVEDCGSMHRFLRVDPYGQILLDWYRTDGKAVYLRYLLHDPIHTLSQPLRQLESMLSPDSTEYRLRVYPDPAWIGVVRQILLPRSTALILIWSAALLLAAAWLLSRGGNEHLLIPSIAILILFGLTFIIWHGDGIELERHATQISLQLKICLWIAFVFTLDNLLDLTLQRLSADSTRK